MLITLAKEYSPELFCSSFLLHRQTLANVYLALENDLEIIPILNKIDLPAADPDRVTEEIEDTIGLDTSNIGKYLQLLFIYSKTFADKLLCSLASNSASLGKEWNWNR